MKHNIFIVLALCAALFCSCDGITYTGDYSKNGYYTGKPQVYFQLPSAQDTVIRYSFATDWVDVQSHTVKIPVHVLGDTPTAPLHYAIQVNQALSTAKEGVNYKALPEQFELSKDSILSNAEITIFRKGLSTTEEGNIKLVLDLIPTDELTPVDGLPKRVVLTFDDYLKKPEYWMYYEYYWGPYSRELYLKILSYYDGSETKFWSSVVEDFTAVSVVMQKVFKYFEQHPEYGITTPPTLPKPFND